MRTQEIVDLALQLDPADRIAVAEGVLNSLDQPDASINQSWADEALRRLAEYRAGITQGIPAEDIFGPL